MPIVLLATLATFLSVFSTFVTRELLNGRRDTLLDLRGDKQDADLRYRGRIETPTS